LIVVFSVFIFYTSLGSTFFLILMDCSCIGCAPSGGALTEGMMGWQAVGGSPRAQRRATWLCHGGGAACSQRVRRSTDSDPASERDSGGGASPGSWSSRLARSSPCLRPPRSPAVWKWRRHGVGVGRCLQKLHPPAMNQA
jgi:hypothetical protein